MCKDLIHQDATFMAEAIRNGQTNSFELVSLHRERYQKFNSKLNGIVTFAENALEEAINADKEFKVKIIETLWSIIYSNKEADMYESNLMRRLSGLLYLDNKMMGEIKERVKKKIY